MNLSEMPKGTALILKKEKGINDTFDKSIKEGEYFVEMRDEKDNGVWHEIKLAEQPEFYTDEWEEVKKKLKDRR